MLLAAGSLPWSTKNSDFKKLETSQEIKLLLKKAKIVIFSNEIQMEFYE